MAEADLSKAVEAARVMAREHFDVELDPANVDALFRELLWGPRETWRCFVDGLITRREAANLLVAHLDSRLIRRDPQRDLDWNVISAKLCLELWRVFPSTGPAALAIELVPMPSLDTPRLVPRTHDPENDNVRPILHDVCDHMQEHHLAELTYRIGASYVWADVRTDLCIVLEQLPRAIAAIAERRDFEIDNYEQGFETKLAFTWRDDSYAMAITREWIELSDPLPVSADELLDMLLQVRARFMVALRRCAPELEPHPWMQAWLGVRT